MSAPTPQPSLGVCYYPEHWTDSQSESQSEAQWKADAAAMAAAGITWVRIGEFCWSRIETTPGEFTWGWLDSAVEILAAAGLKIVMCTPTATPPKWVVDKMPDMIAIDASGAPRKFGSRRHYSFAHQGYLQECKRITKAVAERYGAHPAVHAWQTDNEYGCHDTAISYCQAAQYGFQQWLADRYQTITALNNAWGNVFWSMEYTDFDQIELPNLTVTEANPAHAMDFRRFNTDLVVAFNRAQVDIIRQHSPDRPISHNFMGDFNQFDHRPVAADLEIAAWDSYPLGMLQNMQLNARLDETLHRDCLRTGDPDFQAFHHDLYRGMGRLWVMEQQPGPVNWARTNVIPADGAVRMWSWEAIAHGAEVVSYFRWRQAPFAQEQMHAGLNLRDGTPAVGLAEASQVAQELATLPLPATTRADIALVHDYQADWMSELDGQTEDYHYLRLILDMYRAVRQHGGSLDVLGPNDDLSGYKLILLPGLMHVNANLAAQLNNSDAVILAGPRSGAKTETFQLPENLAPGPLQDIVGFTATRIDALPAKFPIEAEWNGITGTISIWHERGVATAETTGATALGDPILVTSNHGRYLTGWPDEALLRGIVGDSMQAAGILLHEMPRYLRLRRRGGYLICTNYGPDPAEIPQSITGTFHIGGRVVPPAGVSVIETD